jgi:hypothetical protein
MPVIGYNLEPVPSTTDFHASFPRIIVYPIISFLVFPMAIFQEALLPETKAFKEETEMGIL